MDYMEKAQELEEGPTLLDSFLLYMDALGTEAAVSGSHEAVEARFQSFRSAWEQAREVSGLSDPSIPTSVFSDLVVAGLPVDEDGEGELASLIFTGSAFQYFLSIQGIFLRGALVRGNSWIHESFVYGPALMQAYRQERQDAVYPRIVVPNEVQEAIRSYMPYYGGKAEKTPQCKQLLVDQAGVVFVDYLRTTFHFPDAEMQVDSLRDHRSAVLSGLLDTRHDPRAQDKMYWSARYHNYFAQTHFPVVPELLIEERDPHLEFFSLADYWSDEP